MSSVITDNLRERHRRIRGALVAKGTSFDAWCRQEGASHLDRRATITRQNADKALLGQWKGPTATALVARILATGGVPE